MLVILNKKPQTKLILALKCWVAKYHREETQIAFSAKNYEINKTHLKFGLGSLKLQPKTQQIQMCKRIRYLFCLLPLGDAIACLKMRSNELLPSEQGCGAGVGGFWVESESDFFLRHRKCNWIIFYIGLLNWDFLLKLYSFFWNFCWNRDSCCAPRLPLILTVKFNSLYVKVSELDILPATPWPCIWASPFKSQHRPLP